MQLSAFLNTTTIIYYIDNPLPRRVIFYVTTQQTGTGVFSLPSIIFSKISAVPVKYIPFKKAHDIKLNLGHAPVLDLPFQVRIKLKLQVFNQTSGETEKVFRKRFLNSNQQLQKKQEF